MNNLTAEKLGYIAGFIDAEASLKITKRMHKTGNYIYTGYSVMIDVSSTSKQQIDWLLDNFGGTIGIKPVYNKNSKPAYWWRLGGKETLNLLKLISHLLVTKNQQADNILKFPFGKKNNDAMKLKEELFCSQRILNSRGNNIPVAETE